MEKTKLKTCQACGAGISAASPFCRQCGHPQGYPLALALMILFGVVLLGAYMAFCLYGITMCG